MEEIFKILILKIFVRILLASHKVCNSMHLITIFHSCDVVHMVQFNPWFKCHYPLFQMNLHLFNIFEKKKKRKI